MKKASNVFVSMVVLSVVVIFTFFFSGLLLQGAFSQQPYEDKGIFVSPVKFEYNAKPGDVITGEIKVYNSTSSNKTVYLFDKNFKSDGLTGTPLFFDTELPYEASLKDWMTLSKSEVLVKKVEPNTPNMEKIQFTIKVPKNAEPGGHYAGILTTINKPGTTSDTDKANIIFQSEQGALVILNIEGNVTRDLSILDFYAADAFLFKKEPVKIFEWMPVEFVTTVKNNGNTHITPIGNIFITQGENSVDAVKFNESQGLILRESTRVYTNDWTRSLIELEKVIENGKIKTDKDKNIESKFKVQILDKDENGNPRFMPFRIGQYKAKLALVYDRDGQKQVINREYTFWVIPWKLILLILAIITIIIVIIVNKRKQSKKNKS